MPLLDAAELYRRCDSAKFKFDTTAELAALDGIIGQGRALAALQFGIGMRSEGYNLYVLGPPGTGKQTAVRQYLELQATHQQRPPDWCYVNNFQNPRQPRVLTLPAGRGHRFKTDMEQLLEELKSVIPAAFESDEYQKAIRSMDEELKHRQEQAFEELGSEAATHGLGLIRMPAGFLFAPLRDGEVLAPEKVAELPEEELNRLQAEREKLEVKLEKLLREIPRWRRETREKVRLLNEQIALEAVGCQMAEIHEHYVDLPDVQRYLDDLQRDVLEHLNEFQKSDGEEIIASGSSATERARRYTVNLIVDNGAVERGAPVVFEDHPTYQNLVGRVEHIAQMGALITDFTLIRAGALHRANGGYLVLDAHKILSQPFAWAGLKRALRASQVCIESLGQALSLVATAGLEPQPIPLNVKVVLIGERLLYYLLCEYDPDFNELFKVAADFEDRIERNDESDLLYARLISTLVRKEGLRHFDRLAVGRVIEQAARLAADATQLSTHMRSMADLMREANYWAGQAKQEVVRIDDVRRAISEQTYRANRVPDRLIEAMRRNLVLIDTDGEMIGQINGLSVLELGAHRFGQPSRITATVRLGEGEVIDIEREVELGGALHSKGVMILSAYLASRYASENPLSLSATVVFEQNYGYVEGDSASVAELCALLSVLAQAPIRQCLAVTGSVNQHGVVQAIGGVNEKIEGFFDLCKARGLTGRQGVLVPEYNVQHLMLREDIVEAAAAGRFHVHSVRNVDEAIEILTGVEAGVQRDGEYYPQGSINARVSERLYQFAEIRRSFSEHSKEGADGLDSTA